MTEDVFIFGMLIGWRGLISKARGSGRLVREIRRQHIQMSNSESVMNIFVPVVYWDIQEACSMRR